MQRSEGPGTRGTTGPSARPLLACAAMDRASIRIGRVEVTALTDAEGDTDPITEAFPGVPAEDLLGMRDRYPGIYGTDDAWRLIVRAWLVRHPDGLSLMDTGIGVAAWFPTPGRLQQLLEQMDVRPADIDTVVISHVHDDHVGGTVTPEGPPAFPNARYVIQAADIAAQRTWATEDEWNLDIWDRLLVPIIDAGVVQEVDGDHVLTDLLRLQHAPGHTPGHQVLHVEDAGERLVITADTWNHPGQLAHPEWPSGADADHAGAAAARHALMPALTAEPAAIIAPTHFAEAFGLIVDGPTGEPAWAPHTA